MGAVLEEPREDDVRYETDGIPVMAASDAAVFVRLYGGAVLDQALDWAGRTHIVVRLRRSAGCSTTKR
jgi:hypothetical protein